MLIGLLLCPALVQGAFQVSEGQTFTYTVKTSNWRLKYGTTSGSGSGYRTGLVEGSSHEEGTSFTVEVTSVIPGSKVYWDLTAGTETTSGSNGGIDWSKNLEDLLFQPFSIAFSISSHLAAVDMGPYLEKDFFFDTADDVTFDFFRTLADPSSMASYTTASGFAINQMEGHFDESGSVAIFDWILDGTIVWTLVTNIVLEGTERFKIAFDKTTGVLQGYRIELDHFNGTVDGQATEIELKQEVNLAGYRLPGFHFKKAGGFIPGFEWFIPMTAIGTIAIIAVIIRKLKEK